MEDRTEGSAAYEGPRLGGGLGSRPSAVMGRPIRVQMGQNCFSAQFREKKTERSRRPKSS